MHKSKTLLEHHDDINNGMYDVLAKRFFQIASQAEKPKDDIDFLTKISGSLGHLSHVSIGIEKSFKQEKRLKKIEEIMKDLPLNMQMFNKPEEMQVKYK